MYTQRKQKNKEKPHKSIRSVYTQWLFKHVCRLIFWMLIKMTYSVYRHK